MKIGIFSVYLVCLHGMAHAIYYAKSMPFLVRSNSSIDAKRKLDEDELLSQMASVTLFEQDFPLR